MSLQKKTVLVLVTTYVLCHLMLHLPMVAASSSSQEKCKVKKYVKSSKSKYPSHTNIDELQKRHDASTLTLDESQKRRRVAIDQTEITWQVTRSPTHKNMAHYYTSPNKGGANKQYKSLSKIKNRVSKSLSHSQVTHSKSSSNRQDHSYYYDDIGHWHWEPCGYSSDPVVQSESPSVNSSLSTPTVSPIRMASPVQTSRPSSAPTTSPSLLHTKSLPWCQSLHVGEVFRTNLNITTSFKYELLSTTSMELEITLSNLESKLKAALANTLMDCDGQRKLGISPIVVDLKVMSSMRTKRMHRINQNHSRRLRVDGIDTSPSDTIDTSMSCSILVNVYGVNCNVVDGSLTLYLQENSTDYSVLQSGQDALKAVQSSMNGLDLIDPIVGIIGTYYLGGSIGGISPNDNDSLSSFMANTLKKQVTSTPGVLSSTGISIVTVAALVTVCVALILTRKKVTSDINIVEGYEIDDLTVAQNWDTKRLFPVSIPVSDDDTEVMSLTSSASTSSGWRKGRCAHVIGESDSVISSNCCHNIDGHVESSESSCRLYGAGKNVEVSYHDSDQTRCHAALDVHICTSTTCQICDNRRHRLAFVTSDIMTPVQEEDTCSQGLPQHIGARSYPTDNTVEL